MIVFIKVKLLTNKDMKKIIDEINKSYQFFVNAEPFDVYTEIKCIKFQAEELIKKCDDLIKEFNHIK